MWALVSYLKYNSLFDRRLAVTHGHSHQLMFYKLQHNLEGTSRKRAEIEIKIACGEAAKLFL